MFKLFAVSIALSSLALAAPAPGGRDEHNNHGFDHVAKFGKGDGKGAIAAGAIGVYNDIYWQGFSIADGKNKHAYYGYGYGNGNGNGYGYANGHGNGYGYGNGNNNGQGNGIGYGDGKGAGNGNGNGNKNGNEQGHENKRAYGNGNNYGNENGKGYMTVGYDGSKYDHFDLNSFYFGCGSGSGKAAGEEAGADCAVTVKGYDKEGKELGSQSFNYKADGGQNRGQQYADLKGGFKGVYKVEFSTSGGHGQSVGTYIDSVGYKVYGKGDGGN